MSANKEENLSPQVVPTIRNKIISDNTILKNMQEPTGNTLMKGTSSYITMI